MVDTIYIVDATELGEEMAAFVSEDQAQEYAELRGLMYYDLPLCDEATGRRMIEEAGRTGDDGS